MLRVLREPDGRALEGRVPVGFVPVGRSLLPLVLRGARRLGLGFEKSLRFVASSGSVFVCDLAAPILLGVFKIRGGREVSFNAPISSLVSGL